MNNPDSDEIGQESQFEPRARPAYNLGMWRFPRFVARNLSDVARATVFPFDRAASRRQFVLIFAVRLAFLVGRRLIRDRCLRHASALAYQTVLTLVPVLAVAVAVASAFDLTPLIDELERYLEAYLLPAAAQSASRQIVELATGVRPKALGLVGGATLVVLSLMLLFNIEQALNEIFRCSAPRPLLERTVAALAVLLFAPLAVGLSLYFTYDLLAIPRFLSAATTLGFTVLALFLCYLLLPHTKVSFRHSLVSAVVAGVLFEAVKIGFAFYVQHLGATLSYLYGTLAILPLTMVWIYVAWVIFLFGAELAAALHEVPHHHRLER